MRTRAQHMLVPRRQPTRADLLEEGVPLAQQPRQVVRSRPDQAFVFRRMHEWRRAHTNASPQEARDERARLQQVWSEMSEEQRAEFTGQGTQASQIGSGNADEELEEEESNAEREDDASAADAAWAIHDDKWPVSRVAVESYLRHSVVSQHGVGDIGIANKMVHLRWAARREVMISDTGAIPSAKKFVHEFSCGERHPGLCCTKDDSDGVYQSCLSLASKIERFFNRDLIGRHFSFVNAQQPGTPYLHVCFVHLRTRRLHAQVTHVFVELLETADGSFACLQSRTHCIQYLTAWDVAKRLVVAGDSDLLVQRFRHTRDDACVRLSPDGDAQSLSEARAAKAFKTPGEDALKRLAACDDEASARRRAVRPEQVGVVAARLGGVRPRNDVALRQEICEADEEGLESSENDQEERPEPPDRHLEELRPRGSEWPGEADEALGPVEGAPGADSSHSVAPASQHNPRDSAGGPAAEGAAPPPREDAATPPRPTQQEAPPSPRPPPPPQPVAPRRSRQEDWQGFAIAPIYSSHAHIGWGVTCGRHPEPDSSLQCKKQITFGVGANQLGNAECLAKLKQWVIEGFQISPDQVGSRAAHVRINARGLTPVADLDAEILRLKQQT